MNKGWPPEVLGGLFCDNKDYKGMYYWMEAIIEEKKFSELKPKESMNVTYLHI